jgi:hypothetical protein
MLGAMISIIALLVSGIASLPMPHHKDDYAETVLEIRNKSMGRPDPKVGRYNK